MKIKLKSIDLKQIYIFILMIILSGNIYGSYIYYKQGVFIIFISSIFINRFKPIKKEIFL
ncbi:hypothetical protein R2R32_02735 [Clostridium perfringens]|nr:hypothetical protein [Clostridium perfringens]